MAEMCHKYDVLCVTDEVYEWLTYDDNVFTKIGELMCLLLIMVFRCSPYKFSHTTRNVGQENIHW